MRGRNRKSHNPLGRLYESNGPDVKIRGTAAHVAEKYVQLARDAQSSGDPVAAENYFQHAEHYFRLIAAAQEQFRQTQPFLRSDGEQRDDGYDDDGDMSSGDYAPNGGQETPQHGQQQSREQGQQSREQGGQQSREQAYGLREPQPSFAPRPQPAQSAEEGQNLDRLPSFITGSGTQPQQGQNGFEGGQQGERFAHRRRRRHRGPRPDVQGSGAEHSDDAGSPQPPSAE